MRFHLGFSFKPKDIIKWIGLIGMAIIGFLQIGGIKSAKAYVKIDSDPNEINIYSESDLSYEQPNNNRTYFKYTGSTQVTNNWLLSPSLYFPVGQMKGEYLSVNARYRVALGTNGGSINLDYITNARNTIKAKNLRCAVNDAYKSGYSTSNGSPNVTNFNVSYNWVQTGVGSNGEIYRDYVIEISFNYTQHIPYFEDNETNIACWFVREPSDGLFGQVIRQNENSTMKLDTAYDMLTLEYALGMDPLTGQLNDINSNISNVYNSLINLVNVTSDVNSTLTDETPPTINDDTFSDIDIASNSAVSGLITMPITILQRLNNNLGNNCTPYQLPFGLTGGNEKVTFPCIHVEEYLGSTIWNYIDLFICFFMIYNIAMLIISSFESITSLEDTFASLYEPRHADTGYKPKHGGDD